MSQQLSPQLRLGFLQSFHFVSAKPPNVEFNFGGPGHGAPIAVPFAEHPPVPASPIAEEQYPSQTPFPRNHVFKMFVPKQMQARQHSNGTQRTSSPAIVAAGPVLGLSVVSTPVGIRVEPHHCHAAILISRGEQRKSPKYALKNTRTSRREARTVRAYRVRGVAAWTPVLKLIVAFAFARARFPAGVVRHGIRRRVLVAAVVKLVSRGLVYGE